MGRPHTLPQRHLLSRIWASKKPIAQSTSQEALLFFASMLYYIILKAFTFVNLKALGLLRPFNPRWSLGWPRASCKSCSILENEMARELSVSKRQETREVWKEKAMESELRWWEKIMLDDHHPSPFLLSPLSFKTTTTTFAKAKPHQFGESILILHAIAWIH